jgi:hypothetical protein
LACVAVAFMAGVVIGREPLFPVDPHRQADVIKAMEVPRVKTKVEVVRPAEVYDTVEFIGDWGKKDVGKRPPPRFIHCSPVRSALIAWGCD